MRFSGKTDIGRKRSLNQDGFYADGTVFAVADGLGGQEGGEIASSKALRVLGRALSRLPTQPDVLRKKMIQAFEKANAQIYGYAEKPEESAMGTTLTAAVVSDGSLFAAHVGDCRLYLYREGRLTQLTHDHSLVAQMVEDGRLSQEDATRHPQRHIITRALGTTPQIEVDFLTYAVRPGDRFLLCSDGLTTMVSEEELALALGMTDDLERACKDLIERANENGGSDNITVVLFEIDGDELQQDASDDGGRSKRNHELLGLILPLGVFVLGTALVDLARNLPPLGSWQLGAVLASLFLALHLAARRLLKNADPTLLPLTAFLVSLGLVMIYRLEPAVAERQLAWLFIGTCAALATIVVLRDLTVLKQYKYSLALLGVTLLLSPIFIGQEKFGARLWLNFGGLSFQPAEAAKLLTVFFLAAYLAEKREVLATSTRRIFGFLGGFWLPAAKHFGPLLTMWAISLAVLVFERDLGTSLLFFSIFLSMLYIATGRPIYVLAGGLLFTAGAWSTYLMFGHVRARIDIWLDPWLTAQGNGYQIVQSLLGIANGGILGTGLGRGYPGYIPAVQTDFIFSAIAEEMGVLGGLAILVVYLVFVFKGFQIARKVTSDFGKLLAAGLTCVFALQTILIIGGVTKLLPLTGVTLPFVSYGGSSILMNYVLLALLLKISNERSNVALNARGSKR